LSNGEIHPHNSEFSGHKLAALEVTARFRLTLGMLWIVEQIMPEGDQTRKVGLDGGIHGK
jgi:hypothetical protein